MQRCFNTGLKVDEKEKAEREAWRYDSVFGVTSDSEDEEVLYEQPKKQLKAETTSLLQKGKEAEQEEAERKNMVLNEKNR